MRPALDGVLAHLAEHEGAVGAAQRAHAEAVEHAAVGKAPVAPGQKACEIGLEIAGAEAGRRRIPDCARAGRGRSTAPAFRAAGSAKCAVDLGAARFGERPRPGLDSEIERGDAMNDRRRRPLIAVADYVDAPDLTSYSARRLLDLLDKSVGAGLADVDIGLGDLGRAFAEHREHRVGALGVHHAGLRIHRDRVLQRGEIELLVLADDFLRHLRHDLFGRMRMDPGQRVDDRVGQRLHFLLVRLDPGRRWCRARRPDIRRRTASSVSFWRAGIGQDAAGPDSCPAAR